jgi:hypothetical protein
MKADGSSETSLSNKLYVVRWKKTVTADIIPHPTPTPKNSAYNIFTQFNLKHNKCPQQKALLI